eukprot:m.107725 g.107725  ORF g.107725 m.107725 type:complete len:83 (-) comp13941_c0_seq10:1171-1419(-)
MPSLQTMLIVQFCLYCFYILPVYLYVIYTKDPTNFNLKGLVPGPDMAAAVYPDMNLKDSITQQSLVKAMSSMLVNNIVRSRP